MTIGVGIFLIAVGAILAYGVQAEPTGLGLDAIGVILMIIGAIVAALSAIFWASWSPYRRRGAVVERDVVVDDADVVDRPVERRRTRRTYREDVI